MSSTTEKYVSEVSQCAKDIRAELKREMPKVRFSVVSKSYSMGNNVTITWELGPTERQVKRIVDKYEAGSFDGMTDSYTYAPRATRTQYSAMYVHCVRHIPAGLFDTMCADYASALGESFTHSHSSRSEKYGQYHSSLVNRLLSVFALPHGYHGVRHVPDKIGAGRLEEFYEFIDGERQPAA